MKRDEDWGCYGGLDGMRKNQMARLMWDNARTDVG